MPKKTTTTVREYDTEGKVIKETVTEGVEDDGSTKEYIPTYPLCPSYPVWPNYDPCRPIWIVDETSTPIKYNHTTKTTS